VHRAALTQTLGAAAAAAFIGELAVHPDLAFVLEAGDLLLYRVKPRT
jgi:hypothetical protein